MVKKIGNITPIIRQVLIIGVLHIDIGILELYKNQRKPVNK